MAAEALMRKARAENFPVASRLLPRRERGHLLALYGFARLVDDAGDEAPGDRLALLGAIAADLERVFGGREPRHPLLRALAPTVRACALPREPFEALIEANRRDQRVRRYRTFEELMDYCALSASPVGRLVLCVFRAATPERIALADAVSSGLQLVEHWQDVAEDLARGRVYLPAEDLARFGVSDADLGARAASPALRALLRFEVERARALLEAGEPLVRSLSGRLALAVAAFVAGGRAALDAIERAGFDVLAGAPRARRRDRARRLLGVLAGARRAPLADAPFAPLGGARP
jgi:squalene synthase HpnC